MSNVCRQHAEMHCGEMKGVKFDYNFVLTFLDSQIEDETILAEVMASGNTITSPVLAKTCKAKRELSPEC